MVLKIDHRYLDLTQEVAISANKTQFWVMMNLPIVTNEAEGHKKVLMQFFTAVLTADTSDMLATCALETGLSNRVLHIEIHQYINKIVKLPNYITKLHE